MPKPVEKGRSQLHEIPASRQGDPAMRKYQQLALTIVAVVSLVAFLFYKHEYERLRYTLEYLDTFGEAPGEGEVARPVCGYNTHHVASSPPADWVQITSDLEVYSAFFDGQSVMGEHQIRVIAAVRKSTEVPSDITCLVWLEAESKAVPGSCSVQFPSDRVHSHKTKEEDLGVLYLLCAPLDQRLMLTKTPYMIQMKVGAGEPSQPVFVHESESLKSTVNRTAVCVVPPEGPVTSLRVVEFVSYYHIIGVDMFTLYGALLTPLARRLLDRYGDEIGLQYHELLFTTSWGFDLTRTVVRRVVELDCLYRHRDHQENVLVVDLDQYVLLGHRATLQATLADVEGAGRFRQEVAEFHLTSQQVCQDKQHTRHGTLLLAQQVHTTGKMQEAGVAVLRPHLLTAAASVMGSTKNQHVPPSVALVHHYLQCPTTNTHEDIHHLPSNRKVVGKLEESILYRKWTINK